jgi:SAM-dependent methyltransferase
LEFGNILNRIQLNNKVLFVWSGQNVPENFQEVISKFQKRIGEEKLAVEHSDRLSLANYSQSTFDFIFSNFLTSEFASHDSKLLSQYLKMLKPKGVLILSDRRGDHLESELKLNGFINLKSEKQNEISIFQAEKPGFEVGAVSKLKFASKTTETKSEQAKVWQFTQDDIQEDDLIDTDELLDEVDLKKPIIETKYDCGTSNDTNGKKKACKNCSCGLAEEIEAEATQTQKKNVQQASVKSACGSCYLGDAFRCASCPYLGMPAFKPGEKIQLNDNLMKSDI